MKRMVASRCLIELRVIMKRMVVSSLYKTRIIFEFFSSIKIVNIVIIHAT
jgi:hypothetical protein